MAPAQTPATSPLLRQLNAEKVVSALRDSGPMTAGDLMTATGMSRPTVHTVCEYLIDCGWVLERETRRPGGGSKLGRPARQYDFNARAGHALGVDLGAHKVRVALTDLRGVTVAERTTPFPSEAVPAPTRLATTREAIARTLADAGAAPGTVLAVAMGVPGPVDDDGHIVAREEYLPELARHDLRTDIGTGFGGPVIVENDANLAVLAERWNGPASGVDNVIVLLAGERLGSGIYLGGRLVRGAGGSAGELELLKLIDGVGNTDAIGLLAARWGAEAVAGAGPAGAPEAVTGAGPADADGRGARAESPADGRGADGREPGGGAAGSLVALCAGDPGRVRAEMVFEAVRAGDPVAVGILERIVERMARVLAVLSTLLNPELIVISGAVAESGDVWLEPLRRRVPELTPYSPRLAVGALGDHSVVSGAVRLALDHIESHLFDESSFPDAT